MHVSVKVLLIFLIIFAMSITVLIRKISKNIDADHPAPSRVKWALDIATLFLTLVSGYGVIVSGICVCFK